MSTQSSTEDEMQSAHASHRDEASFTTPRNSLRAEVSRAVRQELATLGFRQHADDIYSCELGRHALGWVGLGTVRRRSLFRVHLSVDPVIGVRHLPTEQLLATLLGEQLRRYGPPTLSAPLGDVMPGHERCRWLFLDDEDPAERAERMVWTVRTFGLPFLRSHTGLEPLAEALASPGFGFPGQTHLRLPVLYHLLGQDDRAERYVAERLERLGRRADPDAKYYRRFARALRDHVACTGLEHGLDGCAVRLPPEPAQEPR